MGGTVSDWKMDYKKHYEVQQNLKLFNLVKDDEIINGLLLSDAGLTTGRTKFENSRIQMTQSIDHKQLGDAFEKRLEELGFSHGCYFSNGKYEYKGKTQFASRNLHYSGQHPVWTMMRKIWYPNGIKIVPKDIRITPMTLAYLFQGDGSTTKMSGTKKFSVRLCVESFTLDEINLLKLKIEKLGITRLKIDSQNRIVIYQSQAVEDFLKIIEPFILPIFMYKMKYPLVRNHADAHKQFYGNQYTKKGMN